jgi:NADPH:quinone reductase-like Zn-dependent oxidoreductase
MMIEEVPMSRGVRFLRVRRSGRGKIEDVVVPDPGLHEVRLRIKAFGLNRSEILTRSGVESLPLWSKQ